MRIDEELHYTPPTCALGDSTVSLFFSLVDYRNTLLTSNNPQKIMEFYNGFDTIEQLIQWMVERPKGTNRLHEVDGAKDLVVVIPTTSINCKYAKTCRESIFKGLHIIFVESGEGNYYFNYAHNCNVGIQKALEYNPTWIVISNDDMIKIDDAQILRKELNRIQSSGCTMAYVKAKNRLPNIVELASTTYKREFIFRAVSRNTRNVLFLEKKFKIRILVSPLRFPYRWLYKSKYIFPAIGDFVAFNRDVFKNSQNFFDENFVNGGEDIDVALSVYLRKCAYVIIKYKIDSIVGATLGRKNRMLRDILNLTYLNNKIQKHGLLD